MKGNEHADAFADCVVRRTEWDTIMRPGPVLATMVVPAAIAFVIIVLVVHIHGGEDITSTGIGGGVVAAAMIECCVVGLLLFTMTRRTRSHQMRDIIWADSLTSYAGSKGADVSRLESLAADLRRRGRTPLTVLSGAMLGFNVLYLLGLGVYLALTHSIIEFWMLLLVAVSYILLLLQFLLSVGATYGFPHRHEGLQIAFTEELSRCLGQVGVDVPPMKRAVGRPHTVVCLLLFLVTLGLFSVVMFLMACRNMNVHILNQWDYERTVLEGIISAEGGTGIGPMEGSEPGLATRVLRSLF